MAQNQSTAKNASLRKRTLKRLFDIGASGFGLCAVLASFRGCRGRHQMRWSRTVFFRQICVGRNGRPFPILKFRTMRPAAEAAGPNFTVEGDRRITRVGAWLRAAKFDELPQLFNVLAGDMSMVGPRPETPDLMAHYTPEQRADMLSIRPGVTDYASGLAAQRGRASGARQLDPARFYREAIMPVKAELCRAYLEEISLRADLEIILMTLSALISREATPPRKILADAGLAEHLKALTNSAEQTKGRCGSAY